MLLDLQKKKLHLSSKCGSVCERILVDENIPLITVETLRKHGDDVLWNKVIGQQRLLITTDKGFVRKRDEPH